MNERPSLQQDEHICLELSRGLISDLPLRLQEKCAMVGLLAYDPLRWLLSFPGCRFPFVFSDPVP